MLQHDDLLLSFALDLMMLYLFVPRARHNLESGDRGMNNNPRDTTRLNVLRITITDMGPEGARLEGKPSGVC